MNYNRIIYPLVLIFSFCVASYAQEIPVREYFADGKPKVFYATKNGMADGLWLEWYPDGTLRFRAHWKAGKGEGLWLYYFPNGTVRSRTVYQADIPVGLAYEYFPNGQIETETIYLNGQKDGPERVFEKDGSLAKVNFYENGRRRILVPEVFAPGQISDEVADEYSIAFSPTGDRAYFTRRTSTDPAQKIYRTDLINGRWTDPEVAPFSTDTDESPFISPDGKYLYFASYRPLVKGEVPPNAQDMNLWRASWNGENYVDPAPIQGSINQVMQKADNWPLRYEGHPSVDAAGNLYYWTASARGNDGDLYYAPFLADQNSFATSVAIKNVNTEGFESSPTVSPDGKLLCFCAYGRPDGFGGEDIYCARKQADGSWGNPVNLGPEINGPYQEGAPYFSADGKFFYFTRGDGERGVQSDIYVVETASLQY